MVRGMKLSQMQLVMREQHNFLARYEDRQFLHLPTSTSITTAHYQLSQSHTKPYIFEIRMLS